MEWTFESPEQIYPSMMRRQLMEYLHAEGAPGSDFGAAELIYGELISNAIRHAGGSVTVRLEWDGPYAVLQVHGEQGARDRTIALPDDPLAENGRGLYIVNELAKKFELREDGDGCIACATLPVVRLSAVR